MGKSGVPCSLFPVPCSLFPVPCSLFLLSCSLFPVPFSLFPVPRSPFPVPRSLLTFKQPFEVPHESTATRISVDPARRRPGGLRADEKSVYPPTLSIQQLTVLPNGQWRVTLRIQNNSYGDMDFTSVEGQLKFGSLAPIRLHAAVERDIPALAGDVLPVELLPTAPMSQALQQAPARAARAPWPTGSRAAPMPSRSRKSRPAILILTATAGFRRYRASRTPGAEPRRTTTLPRGHQMTAYKAPLDDLRFALFDVLGAEPILTALQGGEGHSRDLLDAVLEEAARLSEQLLAPTNAPADAEGCHFDKATRGDHAEGFQGGVPPVRRGRLDRPDQPRGLRRPGAARCAGHRHHRDLPVRQPGLELVSAALRRRHPRTGTARRGMAARVVHEADHGRPLDRHHVPDRTAGRLRPGPAEHPRRRAQPTPTATRPESSPAPRSSSAPATTTSPKTSCTWCWRACPTRPRAAAASRCSSCPSSSSTRMARSANATPSPPAPSSTRWASTPVRPA